MIRCKEFVTRISSDQSNQAIWYKNPNLFFHYIMCIHCRNYAKQISILNINIKNYFLKKSSTINEDQITNIENEVLKKIINSD